MCTSIPPSPGVAPGPSIPCGKANSEPGRARPGLGRRCGQPGCQPVGRTGPPPPRCRARSPSWKDYSPGATSRGGRHGCVHADPPRWHATRPRRGVAPATGAGPRVARPLVRPRHNRSPPSDMRNGRPVRATRDSVSTHPRCRADTRSTAPRPRTPAVKTGLREAGVPTEVRDAIVVTPFASAQPMAKSVSVTRTATITVRRSGTRAPGTGFVARSSAPARRSHTGAENRGSQGARPPASPARGRAEAWPQGVSWLVSTNHADSRVICMTGSRGRPGLLRARRGERSEPERALSRDGGRIDMLAGRKGPWFSVIATVLPNVLNGYTSIEARTTSTGEGKNT